MQACVQTCENVSTTQIKCGISMKDARATSIKHSVCNTCGVRPGKPSRCGAAGQLGADEESTQSFRPKFDTSETRSLTGAWDWAHRNSEQMQPFVHVKARELTARKATTA